MQTRRGRAGRGLRVAVARASEGRRRPARLITGMALILFPPALHGEGVWESLVARHGFKSAQVGLLVLDGAGAARGAVDSRRGFRPASNQKILVAAAGLDLLGPQWCYETTLWSDRLPRDGVLDGDLAVSGSGDPNISGRFSGGDPTAIFRHWAALMRANGVQRVRGDLLVDDFAFDDERFNSSWKRDQASRWYSAQVGALNFNDNCVDVVVTPGEVGDAAAFRLVPATAYVRVENLSKTLAAGKLLIGLDRSEGTNRIVFKGSVPKNLAAGSEPHSVTVDDPGLFFGTVLKEVFAREGLFIDGAVRREAARLAPPANRLVLHRHQAPLAADLPVILEHSQNLHAEVLLKALGRAASGAQGSVTTGRQALIAFLEKLGIARDGVEIADGSGYSGANRVSPEILARVLAWVSRQGFFALFKKSLAIGGASGTLARRFRDSPLKGRVFAKSGYISGVSTLSGYLEESAAQPAAAAGKVSGAPPAVAPAGESKPDPASASATRGHWSFAILINGFPRKGGLAAAHALQEDLLEEVLRQMDR